MRDLMIGTIAAAVLVLAASACGAGDAPRRGEWTGTIDTLANGAAHVRNPRSGMWAADEGWRIVEELRIGTAMGEGPEMFGSVTDLAVDDYGRIWVLDRQANELRVFAADGEHVRTVGREGGGPGEFNRPVGLAWGADGRLWVADPRNARYSVFDTTGAFVTSHRRPIGGVSLPWPGGIDAEGRLYDLAFTMDERRIVRFDSVVQPVDTFVLPSYDDADFFELTDDEGRGRIRAGIPFGAGMVRHIDRRGSIWFGVNDRYRIVQRRLDSGDTVRIIERAHDPVPVTAEDREEAVENMEWFTRQGGTIDPSRIPDRKPAFREMFTDDRGYLWVVPSVEGTRDRNAFDVFDPDGRYLGRVHSDSPVSRPRILGDRMYFTTRDDMDVPYVIRARIEGRVAGMAESESE